MGERAGAYAQYAQHGCDCAHQRRLLDLLAAADHARRRPAQLDKVLAHALAVKHGVKRRHLQRQMRWERGAWAAGRHLTLGAARAASPPPPHLVHAHRRHLADLGHLVHGCQRQKVARLPLREVQQRNNRRLLVVGRVLGPARGSNGEAEKAVDATHACAPKNKTKTITRSQPPHAAARRPISRTHKMVATMP